MHDNTQPAFQPYVKLVQSNMEVLGKYSTSREAISQAMAKSQKLLRPRQGSRSSLNQSNALNELARELIKNHTVFANEMGERGIALLAQRQATLIQQAQQATNMVRNAAGRHTSGSR
jgi:hypothetical protein